MAKEEKIIETSKQVVQSYLLTTAGRDWGVYAEKFLLRLIEIAQCDIQGMDFRKGTDMKPHNPSLNYPLMTRNEVGDAIITIPIKSLLPDEGYTNYEYIREAIEQLQTKVLRWEETKTDKNGNIIKINLFGHSFGGATTRLFTYILANGGPKRLRRAAMSPISSPAARATMSTPLSR